MDKSGIVIHSFIASVAFIFAGAGIHIGYLYGNLFGILLALASCVSVFSVCLYWPLRELLQHNRKWGSIQSQLEWIVSVLSGIVFIPTGYIISKAFL